MSARPDIRQLTGGSAGNPGAAPAHNPAYYSRHPPLNARHTPANYLVDAAAAAAAGKSMRGQPQGTPIGLPASVSGLTIGRSSSPASRTPASMYQPGGLNQRVLTSADAAGQAQARYNFQAAAAAAAANPAALMGIRGDPAAYLRGNSDRGHPGDRVHIPHSTSSGASSAAAAVAAASRLTLNRGHPNQAALYSNYTTRGYVTSAASNVSTSWSRRGHYQTWMNNSMQRPRISTSSDPAYALAAAQIHPATLQNLHPGALTASSTSSAAAAISAAANAAAIAAANAANAQPEVVAHKRPRLDLNSAHPHASSSAGTSSAGGSGSASITAPLRIDTRDQAVKESCYQPQVEAISPTGPEAPGDQMDDLKVLKDDLLSKITKVDREIAKTESQIAKLKKKYQEQEEHANKPLSDTNEDSVEEKQPKNQSIAQIIYAENRKKAKSSHEMLEKYAVNELPLYNQPSDTTLYHKNKRNHAMFKKVLVDHFRRKSEEKDSRERYLTETYAKMSAAWTKKVERVENSRKRKERDAKARELYEKIFPELRKQREDKERDHRLGTRGAVRSEADIEDVIERLQEQEMEDKKMHSLAVIPPLLLPTEERGRKFTNNNGLILDPLKEYSERKFVNTWTETEKEIFKEKFLLHPKNFGLIAQSLERKTVADCVQYYYLSKKTENYKQLLRKSKMGRGRRRQPNTNSAASNAAATAAASDAIIGATTSGVLTRNRNKNENDNSRDGFDGSNRSTPQPGIKQEPKDEKDDDDKKGGKSSKDQSRHDSSDDEDNPQSVKSGPHQKGNCPIPTCTSTKSRVKGRLRHIPNKLKDLPSEAKEAILNEFKIAENAKKCCSACFTRLTRRIAQVTENQSSGIKNEPQDHHGGQSSGSNSPSIGWTEDEIEVFKHCLKSTGRNWAVVSQKVNNSKTPEQCKKFFYNNRKKFQLDKLVTEYKRSTLSGDQPPTLSSDEESGSSTSSCEEGPGGAGNSATPSGNSSPVPRKPPVASEVKPPVASTSSLDIKPPIKAEDVKMEVKTEAPAAPQIGVISVVQPQTLQQQPQHTLQPPTKKEEEYDSSATMSADERESDNTQPRAYLQQQAYLPPGMIRGGDVRAPFVASQLIRPQGHHMERAAVLRHCPPMARPLAAPFGPAGNQVAALPAGSPAANNSKDTITVKELMINVIEKSLSHPTGQAGVPNQAPNQPPPSPTIQNLLDGSTKKPPTQPNYVRDRIGLNPLPRSGTMAPPAAPGPPAQVVPAQAPPSNDCGDGTLDLSMPRRRESAATPPSFAAAQAAQGGRDPILHRRSPSFASSASSAADARPPPAHANKVKTDPYLKEIAAFDSRGAMATPSHLLGTSPSPGPPRPPSQNRVTSQGPPPPQGYNISRAGGHLPPSTLTGRQPALSPKMTMSKPPLTIQTGSITQGTPVQQQALQQRYNEPLLKMTPPEARASAGGSITQGTPVFDKSIRRNEAYYPQGASRSSASASQNMSQFAEQHLTSRQVIMNDFAMARSNEMQARRPDSRDSRAMSPSRMRDLSPRPRPTVDPRTGQLLRDGRPVSTDPRLDPRYIAAVASAASAEQHRTLGGLEARGDPKADFPSNKDPRGLQRAQPAVTLPRNYFLGPSTTVQAQSQQQIYLTADGRYTASHPAAQRARSPPRSTPPPSRPSMAMPRQQGGITSGKPIVTKELYRGAPEVTISKTSSPRGQIGYSEVANNPLASLVDVAVQQPKIDLNQIRQQHTTAALMAFASNPKAAASLGSTSASQLVQQVQAERSKQYFLVNEAAAAQAAQQAAAVASNSASYSSAARITPASSKQPTSGSSSAASAASIVSRADAPAVIINERDRQQMAMKMLTAQSVIDAIITQSIQGNPAAAAAAVSSGGHEAAAHKLSQEEMVKAARAQLEQQQAQQQHHAQQHQAASEAAAAAAAAARSSSRPPSSHERPSLPPDMVLNKELSITPAPTGTKAEEYLKQRQIMITTSATLTPTSSAAPTRVSDERQIIRVAQAMSPAKVSAAEAAIEAARKATSPPNGDQPPHGIMTLDYVKNKIVEAMKKQGEEDPASTSTSSGATKRASPDMASEDASSPKKKKTEDDVQAPSTAQPPVDSPGSPGDMVIDESAQESTPKAASPAMSASTAASNPPTSSEAAPQTSAAQPVNSKYEPLSDDE